MKRLLITLPLLLSLMLLAVPSGGEAVAAKPEVKLKGVGQNQITKRQVLKVRVKSNRKGRIAVRALSGTYDRNGKFRLMTRVKRPNFRRAGQVRVIQLRVKNLPAREAEGCGALEIQARAGKHKSRVKTLVRQGNCAPQPIDLSRAGHCEFIAAPNPRMCMNPFPTNRYTQNDPLSETGRRVNMPREAMPVNRDGDPIEPAAFNESDGFSQGQTLLVRVPGLTTPEALAATDAAPLADPGRYLDADAPVVVMNARTRERHPIWVELDSTAPTEADTQLMIHPQVNWDAGTRYLVALRNLKDADGQVLDAPMGFRYYRDVLPSNKARINQRRSYFEDMIFRPLRNNGITRSNLYLAWDFTVASDENNTGRALSMRDQAFELLGDTDLADRVIQGDAPEFTVTEVQTNPTGQIARRIKGTYRVPCFLEGGYLEPCGTGGTLKLDPQGVPEQNGYWDASFDCAIPNAVTGNTGNGGVGSGEAGEIQPGRSVIYGHGLMGSIDGELTSGSQKSLAQKGFVVCGTDEIGMSTGDLLTVFKALADLSEFPTVADRLQQGLLNELFLSRLMIHPEGFVSKLAFQIDETLPEGSRGNVPGGNGAMDDPTPAEGEPGADDLKPAMVTGNERRGFYRGNSQGGIMGGALTALAPDFDHSSLGVGAMNYSVLLNRSVDWDMYENIFNPAYPNHLDRQLALGVTQMLWDRGEPNGYAHRMTTDPLPNTPPHKVLMDVGFSDKQVTNWQSNVQARTIGARGLSPFVYPGRWDGVEAEWGIDPIETFPYDGSALTYWDIGPIREDPPGNWLGNDPPPLLNIASTAGKDSHSAPRNDPKAITMFDLFLREDGAITDQCGGHACYADGFTGP